MRIERLDGLPGAATSGSTASVVAVGNFDGVHRGHLAALDLARREADRLGCQFAAVTFDPHPARFLRPESAPRAVTTFTSRLERLRAAGVERLVVLEFNAEIAAATPEDFVERFLVGALGARCLVEGENFRFGRGRSGDLDTLRALGRELGFAVVEAPTVHAGGEVISSTRLRRALADADLRLAEELTGRPYEVDARVVPGAGRGRALGFPTANLEGAENLALRPGVYAAEAEPSGPEAARGTSFPAVVHCGPRPTFSDAASLEAHLIGFSGPVTSLRLRFRAFLREIRAFDGPASLGRQIERDIARAGNLDPTRSVSPPDATQRQTAEVPRESSALEQLDRVACHA